MDGELEKSESSTRGEKTVEKKKGRGGLGENQEGRENCGRNGQKKQVEGKN